MALILIVEDEYFVAQLIQDILIDEGHEVLLAGHGREGLALVKQRRPDMILSDIMMPIMSGLELCAHVQSDAALSAIPVVLMTAAMPRVDTTGCRWAAFLNKPFELTTLLATIDGVLSGASRATSNDNQPTQQSGP